MQDAKDSPQMIEKEVNINFRGTEEYREKLARAALDRKVKVQRLLELAVEFYLSNQTSVPLRRETPSSNVIAWKDKLNKITDEIVSLRAAIEEESERASAVPCEGDAGIAKEARGIAKRAKGIARSDEGSTEGGTAGKRKAK